MNIIEADQKPYGVPLPFSKGELQKEIFRVHLALLRLCAPGLPSRLMEKLISSEMPYSPFEASWEPWTSDEEFNACYEAIRDTELAETVETQFEFGFHGVRRANSDLDVIGGPHTSTTAILFDLKDSEIVRFWADHGLPLHPFDRCFHVAELANARLVLEGQEPFYSFEPYTLDGLTIHQMALLSGMAEMSIRTAASRKGPKMLQTFKDERGRTLIRPEVAQEWLRSRNRYVPIVAKP